VTTVLAPLVLIADDDSGIRLAAERFVTRLGFRVIQAADGREALAAVPSARPDVALVDLQMPHVDGLEVLRALRHAAPDCKVILMTARPTVETAIDAVKLGALDYLAKPFDFDRLRELLTGVTEQIERRRELFATDRRLAEQLEFCGLIGRSAVMQELFDTIRRLAPHVRTALVTGETGTGKELVARALHQVGSRRERLFMTFNCSAIVETLFETEFFGHTRGAFTGATDAKQGLFERADGGTLFLDEIGELQPAMQAKLLRVVEGGEVQRVGATEGRRVDVRVIAATNRDLHEEVRAGRFREDLYYRFNVVELALPPLRQRREDIPYMTAAFVKEFAKRFEKPLVGLTAGAERRLQSAPWPGNVRELRNTLERACMLSESRILTEGDILAVLKSPARPPEPSEPVDLALPSPHGSRNAVTLTREHVAEALQQVGGNRSAAARALGVSRRALYRRLDSFGLR
jgi:DNA-binding NtrC family response regulator